MKTLTNLSILLFVIISMSSCKNKNGSASPTSSIVTNGTWRVTYYWDKTKDETADFSGHTFQFNSNGNLLISHSSMNVTGNWMHEHDDSNGGIDKMHFSNCGTTSPYDNLNDDWVITSQTNSKIELKDDHNNNEILHFTKN